MSYSRSQGQDSIQGTSKARTLWMPEMKIRAGTSKGQDTNSSRLVPSMDAWMRKAQVKSKVSPLHGCFGL